MIISFFFILNLNFTPLSTVLLNESLLRQIYLLKLYQSFCQFTRADGFNLFCAPAKPLIKFPILFCHMNSVILDSLVVILIGSEVTYHRDFLSFAVYGSLSQLFPCS
jgi:hypothetical protein